MEDMNKVSDSDFPTLKDCLSRETELIVKTRELSVYIQRVRDMLEGGNSGPDKKSEVIENKNLIMFPQRMYSNYDDIEHALDKCYSDISGIARVVGL